MRILAYGIIQDGMLQYKFRNSTYEQVFDTIPLEYKRSFDLQDGDCVCLEGELRGVVKWFDMVPKVEGTLVVDHCTLLGVKQ